MTEPIQSIDKWILSELNTLIRNITNDMDNYDLSAPSKRIEEFTDILSNWYVRRSRRRLWDEADSKDKIACQTTLHEVITTVCQMVAPIAPHTSEYIYLNLTYMCHM